MQTILTNVNKYLFHIRKRSKFIIYTRINLNENTNEKYSAFFSPPFAPCTSPTTLHVRCNLSQLAIEKLNMCS